MKKIFMALMLGLVSISGIGQESNGCSKITRTVDDFTDGVRIESPIMLKSGCANWKTTATGEAIIELDNLQD